MALYKEEKFLKKSNGADFDKLHEPGEEAPYAGIYRCTGCGREISIAEGKTLPPQNHHQHSTSQGKIRWQLIVYADHKEK